MGINGLWDILSLAQQVHPLTQLALEKGFLARQDGERMYRLGVDASIWINQAECAHLRRHYQKGENPELKTLYARMVQFSKLPIIPIFVFDGPGRPSTKRGRAVQTKAHWLTAGFQDLIIAFGFHVHNAPGEAEAELAYMNRIGIIDSVVTNDNDVFVHGATSVIQTWKIEKNQDAVTIFELGDFQRAPYHLSRGSLLLIALLSGGDYHDGLDNCGPVISYGLAKSGLGDTLFNAVETLPPVMLPGFLAEWAQKLRHELRTNQSGFLGRRYADLANEIPNNFPDPSVIRLYTQPLVSAQFNTVWVPRQPDIARLAFHCERFFTWGSSTTIASKFANDILPGAVIRSLCEPFSESSYLAEYAQGVIRDPGPVSRGSVMSIIKGKKQASGFQFCVKISATRFISATLSGLLGTRLSATDAVPVPEFQHVWIPREILEYALPQMVLKYQKAAHSSRKQHRRAPATLKPNKPDNSLADDTIDDELEPSRPRNYFDELFDQVMSVRKCTHSSSTQARTSSTRQGIGSDKVSKSAALMARKRVSSRKSRVITVDDIETSEVREGVASTSRRGAPGAAVTPGVATTGSGSGTTIVIDLTESD